jgi:hypothetical protein
MTAHRPGPARSLLPALVGTLLLTTACQSPTSDAQPTPSTGTSSAATSTATPPPVTGPREDEVPPPDASFPASADDDRGEAVAGDAVDRPGSTQVTALRLTQYEGFERLVIELDSSGVPPWVARYSEPTDPDGQPVELAGDAHLRLTLFTQAEDSASSGISVSGSSGSIVEAVTTGVAAGNEEVLVGVRGGAAPFRAFALTDPGRLVVDIRPAP